MANKRVQRIERQPGGGVRVTLTDGTAASYRSAADLPGDLLALLSRFDAADGGDSGQQPQGDADAARAGYRARLEAAHEAGRLRADPYAGLSSLDRYRGQLQAAWQTPPPAKGPARKRWGGA